ncbi:MAG: phage/plasmid primase, P4 family, partial [Candidatus Hydrogenedentes bacterium]|nr:phage/plasmid primase, P4 family [Candidatus Hydrogenedentota bacterium]
EVRAKVSLSDLIGRRVELQRKGSEFSGLCPFHNEKTPSFTVSDEKGFWHCFGCGAHGDIFGFVMRMEGISNFREGVKLVCDGAGISMPGTDSKPDIGGEQKTKWTPISPVPADAPGPSFQHHRLGSPSPDGIWAYRNAESRVVGYVVRFDKPDGGKEILPFVLCETQDGRKQWRWQGFPVPRPLYGLEVLAAKPDANVVIVEGEKACDAARQLFPSLAVVTWVGGTNAILKIDWSPLKGRKVVICPDADEPGRTAADGHLDESGFFKRGIAQILTDIAEGVRVVDPPADVPKGWDLADALADGCTPDQALATLKENMREPTPEPLAPDDIPLSDDDDSSLDAKCAEFSMSDTGNAERLIARHGKDIICISRVGWAVWDGRRFVDDELKKRIRLAKKTAGAIEREAIHIHNSDPKIEQAMQTKRIKFSVLSRNAKQVNNMIAMAEPEQLLKGSEMDADKWLFNCEDGTIDLRTGLQHKPIRSDRITKMAPVIYDRHATCPAFDAFLCEVFGVNIDADDEGSDAAELISFVLRAIGYSLTGDTSEHVMFILYGAGRNGKSTLLETLAHVFGDYAMNTTADTFMSIGKGTGIPNDIARLKGARFVTAVESAAGRRMNEALVKQATGGDTMTARFLNKEYFDFKPQFKLWLGTNHKPDVRGTDRAIWSRLVLIPFTETFYRADDPGRPADARLIDPNLLEKLKLEAPGIMRRAVEGCLDWQRGGLRPPAIVRAAISGYRAEQDVVGEFIEAQCDLDPKVMGLAGELYKSYITWANQNGVAELSTTNFGISLGDRGLIKDRMGGHRIWKGIDVKDEFKIKLVPIHD